MSNLNDYVTHGELNEIVSAIGEIILQSESRIMAFIENGVQKQANAMAEMQNAMEEHLGNLTEKMQGRRPPVSVSGARRWRMRRRWCAHGGRGPGR